MLDRISNVGGGGWPSVPPGQNGASIDDNTGDVSDRIEFISMYRNRGKLGKNDGSNRAHWIASTNIYSAGYKGTPGAKERSGPKTFAKSATGLKVVFNEVGNYKDADHEWIELMVREGTPNFENWQVSIVTKVGTDTALFTLPKIDKYFVCRGRRSFDYRFGSQG